MNKPECRTDEDGTKEWLLNGKYHREDGPAVEFVDGCTWWYLNDKRHREDGPACEYADGDKYWYLDGIPADPETIVDLWLMRGKFCFYDKDNDCLNFG
jgi:hypothetical protein